MDPEDILRKFQRIHVVGASATVGKPAHDVPAYMQAQGYEIVPVNPRGGQILGRDAVPSLAESPHPVEVVNVFRRSEETPEVARQAAKEGAKVLWLQSGIANPETRRIAEEAGMVYVEDLCIRTEHQHLR